MTKNQKISRDYCTLELAINELKQHFEASLEYIEEIQNNKDVKLNLNYILRDNSNLIDQQSSNVKMSLDTIFLMYQNIPTKRIR